MWSRVLLGALLGSCTFSGPGSGAVGGDASTDGGMEITLDAGSDGPAGDGPLGEVERRNEITISGGTTAETLANFPLYVALANDADLADHAATDGADIFFAGADGVTPLDHEIELWDPDTGSLIAWVRVPSIDAATGATLFLRYGDLDAAAAANPAGVWQQDFAAVFHLNNDPDTPIVDSTGARNGTAQGSMDATDLVTAKLGLGLELDGSNDVIDFQNPFVASVRTSAHTISGWVSQAASGDNEAFVVLGTGGPPNRSRFLHSRFDNGAIAVGLYSDDVLTDDDIQDDGFKLVHWTYNNGNQSSAVYIDGALVQGPQQHNNPADTEGNEGRIGNAPGGGTGFGTNMGLNGIVDEVRISTVVRSDAWIAAEFANQNDPDSFYSISAEQTD